MAKQARRARRMYTDAQKKAFVANWPDSGLNKAEYCKEHGLTSSAFLGWVKRIEAGGQVTKPGRGEKRTDEMWVTILEYADKTTVAKACKRFGCSKDSLYARRQWDGRKAAKADGAEVVADKVNGLAKRKPEQTNLLPVTEHEPVITPAFEDMKLEHVFTVDKEDLWTRINKAMAPLDPTARIQVFGMIHQLLEA